MSEVSFNPTILSKERYKMVGSFHIYLLSARAKHDCMEAMEKSKEKKKEDEIKSEFRYTRDERQDEKATASRETFRKNESE